MTPTSLRTLVLTVIGMGVVGYLIFATAYASIVSLPGYAPVTAVLVAVFELVIARLIRERLRGPSRGRQLHPLQVARAAALAKASSAAGSLLLGLYVGFSAWTLPRRDTLDAARDDSVVAVITAAACLLLVVAALVLERACRTPDGDD